MVASSFLVQKMKEVKLKKFCTYLLMWIGYFVFLLNKWLLPRLWYMRFCCIYCNNYFLICVLVCLGHVGFGNRIGFGLYGGYTGINSVGPIEFSFFMKQRFFHGLDFFFSFWLFVFCLVSDSVFTFIDDWFYLSYFSCNTMINRIKMHLFYAEIFLCCHSSLYIFYSLSITIYNNYNKDEKV